MNFRLNKRVIFKVTIGFIFILTTLYTQELYNKKKMTQENLILKRNIEALERRYIHLQEAESTRIKYEGNHISPNLCLNDEKKKEIKLHEIIKESGSRIIVRISEKHCLSCIMSFISILQKELVDFQILYFVDYDTKEKIEYYKNMLNIHHNIYITKDMGIPIEEEEFLYVFVVNEDFQMTHLFVPVFDNEELSMTYVQNIKTVLNN